MKFAMIAMALAVSSTSGWAQGVPNFGWKCQRIDKDTPVPIDVDINLSTLGNLGVAQIVGPYVEGRATCIDLPEEGIHGVQCKGFLDNMKPGPTAEFEIVLTLSEGNGKGVVHSEYLSHIDHQGAPLYLACERKSSL